MVVRVEACALNRHDLWSLAGVGLPPDRMPMILGTDAAGTVDGRPVIGICNTWSELTPCNAHFRKIAEHVKRGIYEAGGFPVEFPVFSNGESNLRPTAMLTRNLAEMAPAQRAQAVVVGTYTLTNRVLYLSVRLVSPANQSIRGVYENKLYLDDNTLRMFGFKFADGSDSDEQVRPPKPSVLDSILY